MFQAQRDADITLGVYRRVPVLWHDDPEENCWGLSFLRMFDMANDAELFCTREQMERDGWILGGNVFKRTSRSMLPLYEAKLIHHFDHRLACYSKRRTGSQDTELPRLDLDEKNDPWRSAIPRYWVDQVEVDDRLARRGWNKGWLLGWRDIARNTDERTMICCVLPRTAVGHKLPIAITGGPAGLLAANFSSFVFDYILRQKVTGTSVTYFILKQLPVLTPTAYETSLDWLGGEIPSIGFELRVLELNYTAYDLEPFAADLGDEGPPFRWDEERRFAMRAELDAAFFHLYGIERDDVDYIMETFPIVKRKDEQRYGTFRTKELILEIYDAMTVAMRTRKPYRRSLIRRLDRDRAMAEGASQT